MLDASDPELVCVAVETVVAWLLPLLVAVAVAEDDVAVEVTDRLPDFSEDFLAKPTNLSVKRLLSVKGCGCIHTDLSFLGIKYNIDVLYE